MENPGTTADAPRRPLVIGIGNDFRGDDGCGRATAREFRTRAAPRISVVETDGDPANLLDLWEGFDPVFVIDAVKSGAPPGTVIRIELGEVPAFVRERTSSTHGLSLADGIALGRSLGRLPGHLILYGIEVADDSTGTMMTPAVRSAVAEVASRLEQELAERDFPSQERLRSAG
jgi:hydrogenase maturation protease